MHRWSSMGDIRHFSCVVGAPEDGQKRNPHAPESGPPPCVSAEKQRPCELFVAVPDPGPAKAKPHLATPGTRPPDARPRRPGCPRSAPTRSEEHTSELQSRFDLVCRLLLEKKK